MDPALSSKPELPTSYYHYLPITSKTDPKLNELRIWVYWDHGGSSPFSGTLNNPSGVAVSMSPGTSKDGVFSYGVTHGLRYMAAQGNRMNRKQIKSVFDRVVYEIEHELGRGFEVLEKVMEQEGIVLKA